MDDPDLAPETKDGHLYRIGMPVHQPMFGKIASHVVKSIGHGWAGWMIGFEDGGMLPAAWLYADADKARQVVLSASEKTQ